MKQIELKITALSPLAIGKKKPGSVSEARDYIPGSVIRGAIAGVMLRYAEVDNQDLSANGGDFQSLFLDEKAAIFHNAYPSNNEKNSEVFVLPATAVSSKTKPGFGDKGNGVFDTLIDRFCAEAYNFPYDPNCPKDQGRVEPYSGFYTQLGKKYQSHSVSKRLLTRVGINRRRATSEEEVLYSLEVLNETQGEKKQPVVYRSKIIVDNDVLANLLAQFINQQNFRFGGATSRGLGKVKIEATVTKFTSNLQSRLEQFNQKLQQRWQTWGIFGEPQQPWQKERTYFTINLQSDAILTENWLRTTVISPQMLSEFTGIQDSSLILHTAYTSYDYISGWNAAWGLMKDIDLVTNKGGVYLFSTTQKQTWLPTLKKISQTGVGKRTTEGFGQVIICHPFHLVLRENPA
ncbi:type III-D CRISPR-associated RAMP protein Csx10 [Oscillatoria salina]|uniref:type III-D CRISPR-associated RAMP protein Csx10 n=1 Tax=Oscillatoria salina TaxID=331517 RepID=UPI001CCCFA53|nr:CRISPR-associated RAMP protein Csx10 [Oscillatoria salina]MBZ8181460.1 CRISPR-associated RAMP protein Csx10 [Oscillatoria salina IIICB1]